MTCERCETTERNPGGCTLQGNVRAILCEDCINDYETFIDDHSIVEEVLKLQATKSYYDQWMVITTEAQWLAYHSVDRLLRIKLRQITLEWLND
jgi:hypothetical protein